MPYTQKQKDEACTECGCSSSKPCFGGRDITKHPSMCVEATNALARPHVNFNRPPLVLWHKDGRKEELHYK